MGSDRSKRHPGLSGHSIFHFSATIHCPPPTLGGGGQWGEMGRNEASLGKRNVAKKIKDKCCRPNSKTLKVRFVTTEDAGVFECQVSTSPKLSLIFRLSVLGKWQKYSCNPIQVPSGAWYLMICTIIDSTYQLLQVALLPCRWAGLRLIRGLQACFIFRTHIPSTPF